ncbi:tautomerase family protein [Rhodococcoides kroppenstedtii]|uniref:tautomerase family protein n=1 Tax=Rhodococcoides kroppenstedtii TaxID=293050 RepID=UPI0028ECEEFA|nr:tautomerase family protein [Rhodococcus kroppenstedtii]
MTLVRIDLVAGRRSPTQVRALADVAHKVLVDTFDIPVSHRYQIVTEHSPEHLLVGDSNLCFDRTEDIVVIHVVAPEVSVHQKQAMFRRMAQKLYDSAGLSQDDLVISVVENTGADWSFGHGVVQFSEKHL